MFKQSCESKIIGEMLEYLPFEKKTNTIFWPPDIKGLKLRRAAFKMLFSQGVRGSSFKRPPIVCAKTVSNLLRESTQAIVYVT